MSRILVARNTLEYFREAVSSALEHRPFKVQAETEFYLVSLLSRFLEQERLSWARPGQGQETEPLAVTFLEALSAGGEQRWRGLKQLGDTALFVSGFFGDSLARSAVSIDYYIAMGEQAYGALGEVPRGPAALGEVFGELADRFEAFVDLYAEIAELSDLRSNRGLVRLYQRFLATGSGRMAELLRERGLAVQERAPGRGLRH